MDTYSIKDYFSLLGKFAAPENLKRFGLMVVGSMKIIAMLGALVLLILSTSLFTSQGLDETAEPQDMFGFVLPLFFIAFSLLFFLHLGYSFLKIYYVSNCFALDALGYHVQKSPLNSSYLSLKFFKLSTSFFYSLYTLFFVFLMALLSIFNFYDKRLFAGSIIILVLGFLLPEPVSSLLSVLFFLLVAHNALRFMYSYHYFLTTELGMFDSFKASYNATERAVLKNLLMAVVSVLLSSVVLVLVFTLSGVPMMLAKTATNALVPGAEGRINQPYLFSVPEKLVLVVSSIIQLLVFLFALLVAIAVPPVFMCCLFSLHYRNASE